MSQFPHEDITGQLNVTVSPGMNQGFMFWVGLVAGADAAMKDACAWRGRCLQASRWGGLQFAALSYCSPLEFEANFALAKSH